MATTLIICHLIGDFLLQNDAMQAKSRCSKTCAWHVAFYATPFLALVAAGSLPLWALCAIVAQHYAQDRYALHLKWMKLYGQTPPEKWPVGPLCMDQAMHVAFIGFVSAFI